VAKIWRLRRDNMTFRVYPSDFIERTNGAPSGTGSTDGWWISVKASSYRRESWCANCWCGSLDDVLDELGSRKEVEYAFRILDEGRARTASSRSLRAQEISKTVVDHVIAETAEGL